MHRNDSFYYWKTWKKTVDSFPLKYRRALNHYVCALHVNPKKSYSISFLNMKKRKMVFSKRGETFWKKLQQTYNEVKKTDTDIRDVRNNMKNYFSKQPIKRVVDDPYTDLTVLSNVFQPKGNFDYNLILNFYSRMKLLTIRQIPRNNS